MGSRKGMLIGICIALIISAIDWLAGISEVRFTVYSYTHTWDRVFNCGIGGCYIY